MKDVAERVAPYDVSHLHRIATPDTIEDEVVQRAATLLLVLSGKQRRETFEKLVAPHDSARGRAAVDALIEAEFATEDEFGRLRRAS